MRRIYLTPRTIGSALLLLLVGSGISYSQDERYAVHGQFTYTEQETSGFAAPYSADNSLSPNIGRETTDATIFLGTRLWPGAEGWINGEIDQGFGLNNTLGAAGFPSAEAYKVGKNRPYLRLTRVLLRHTENLSGAQHKIDPTQTQLSGIASDNRWVFTVGKFSVGDIFDANAYAHDPRSDFLNWTAVDSGSYDYAADAWAYTLGAVAERYQGPWALRAGFFDMSKLPNSEQLQPGLHQFQFDAEIEKRYALNEQPGKVLLTYFNSRARMALLDEATALIRQVTSQTANNGIAYDLSLNSEILASVRHYRDRVGASLNLEQSLTTNIGLFARAGAAGGNVEAYEFTDVDQSLSTGLSLRGSLWKRANDTMGTAAIVNAISPQRRRFLDAGGLGLLVGDGKLPHPGPERILESYYSLALQSWAMLTIDYQWIEHPAYNRDRGPASVFALRLHAQF